MCRIDNEIFNITNAQVRVLESMPVITDFQDATMGPFHRFGIAMLTLTDADGTIGEVPVFSAYTNLLESYLLPILFHYRNTPYREIYPKLYWSIRNEGFRGPASALLGQVDLALHDLAARRHQLPLHTYLNATRNSVKFYGSGGGTNYSFKELEKEISCFLDAGAECYKMKVCTNFGTQMYTDAERVKVVRRLAGDKLKIAIDANQAWTCEQALQFLDIAGCAEIAWFEEPVHSAAIDQIAKLCSSTTVAIAYGESERSSKCFPALVNSGVRHLQPVPTQIGGVKEWMDVRDLAAKSGACFSSGGYSLFSASLMATAGDDCHVEYLYSIMQVLEQYFAVRPEWKNGHFILPAIEGVGVRVDWDYCQRNYRIVHQQCWNSRDVREYTPTVLL